MNPATSTRPRFAYLSRSPSFSRPPSSSSASTSACASAGAPVASRRSAACPTASRRSGTTPSPLARRPRRPRGRAARALPSRLSLRPYRGALHRQARRLSRLRRLLVGEGRGSRLRRGEIRQRRPEPRRAEPAGGRHGGSGTLGGISGPAKTGEPVNA